MPTKWIRAGVVCAAAIAGLPIVYPLHAGPLEVLAAQQWADKPFPEFQDFWSRAAPRTNPGVLPKALSTGGAIHIFLRNTNSGEAVIEDVLLADISLGQAIAQTDARKFKKRLYASNVQFSSLPQAEKEHLSALGEPVWWRAEPRRLSPGAVGEVFIRLRKEPTGGSLSCTLRFSNGSPQTVSVSTASAADRCADACFSPALDAAWLYFTGREDGRVPGRILMDGEDVTSACTLAKDARLKTCPVMLKPTKPFAPASLHCFQAIYEDGASAIATLRVFRLDFVYGLWGAKRGTESNPVIGRAFVQELTTHSINLQMPGVGSPAVAAFYKSAEGQAALEKAGVMRVVNEIGKGGTERAYAFYLADEPDAGDSRVPGLTAGHQVGSLAEGLVGLSEEMRQKDALTPHMLNVDLTFAPYNWYEYGQLPDIFAADPYYQPRLREAYARSRERTRLYEKATFVSAEATICKAACEPRPLHIMLYGNRYEKSDEKFRGPTPPEKRIEAFYAIAAGAKGLSYWWYSASKPAVGLGAAEPKAQALWREVGLLGAELRTAGPLITRSSPLSLPVSAPQKLWVRTLAVGLDSLLLLVVNDDYTNDREGTRLTPIPNSVLKLTPPGWMAVKDCFEIVPQGIRDVAHTAKEGHLELALGTVEVTRLLVLSSDSNLRRTLQKDYETHFAANVQRLLGR